jgi:polysaccharide biosynthesis/export protein
MQKLSLTVLTTILSCVCSHSLLAQKGAASANSSLLSSTSTSSKAGETNNGKDSRLDLRRRDARYRLCASDVVTLTFPLTPEFDQTVSVQPDGFVTLAGAGDVHLEGLTTQEAADSVRAAYTRILHDPLVSIDLKDFNKPYFIVSGQVNQPGKFDLRGEISATQAVGIAGGLKDSAKHSQVLLFRRVNNDWYEVNLLNLKKILQGRDVGEDPELLPGDMVFVPQNFISKIKKFIPTSGIGAYYQP